MRHAAITKRLGRKTAHREAVVKNMVVSLIKHGRIETTRVKAKVAKAYAEKMITLGKRGDLHARRLAFSYLRDNSAVKAVFSDLAPRFSTRKGGYTRVINVGTRLGDAAPAALLEWVDYVLPDKPEPKG